VTDATFERHAGGKGANQAVAAARLGAKVRFIGRIGGDDLVLRSLNEAGVDTTGVVRDDGATGTAIIVVDATGENMIVVAPEANRRLTPEDVRLEDADAVMCQLEVPAETVAAAAKNARFFCLNAAPARGPLPVKPDLLIVNRYEYDAIGGYPGLVALTLGPDGAVMLRNRTEIARAEPPGVTAVDGTAAGDAFCAQLVVALIQGEDHQRALTKACAAGALAASRRGAQPSLPTAEEVDAILSQQASAPDA
jgi:ribokinase